MSRLIPLFAALLVGSAAARADDAMTLAFLGEGRPVLLRLHLEIEGRPGPAIWDDCARRLFEHADRNGNGALDKTEIGRLPSVTFIRSQLSGLPRGGSDRSDVVARADLDSDRDGSVSLDEWRAYLRRNGFGPLQLRPAPGQARSSALNESLFKGLDRDGDGKLSRPELQEATASLHRFDFDEDEMISRDEIVPEVNPYGPRFLAAGTPAPLPSTAPFLLVSAGDPAPLVRALFERYDRNRDDYLSRTEIGLDEATFAGLDTNGNGHLEAKEAARWCEGPSDLELTASLGQPQPRKPASGLLASVVSAARPTFRSSKVDIHPRAERRWPLMPGTHREPDGAIVVTQGLAKVEVKGAESGRFRITPLRNSYLQQFRSLLKEGKNAVSEADARNSPFLGRVFVFADRDGNGQLTEAELTAFLDLMTQAAASFATLTIADQGRGLFELLDADRDGRLSPRELRTAWGRIVSWDRAGVGSVTRGQVPRQFQLVLAQGTVDDGRGLVIVAPPAAGAESGPERGPAWFRKMDRNGDGDVSRREWLGPEEEFRVIDRDGDGLLSAEEAGLYDAARGRRSSPP